MKKGAKSLSLAVVALALGAVAWMIPGAASADFVGPLVECSQVSQPAALTTCASSQDPLTSGNAVIDDQGNLDLVLGGAGAGEVYTIVFRSIDGSTISLGTVTTGPNGNVTKSKYGALPFDKNAAGYIVLSRTGGDQYVTSLFVRPSASDATRASFHVDLMACGAVNDPAKISGCGSDTFKSGSVDVRSDTGAVTVQINGAEVGDTYNVELRAPSGGSTLSLGTVGPTDSKGDATATSVTVPASTIAAGTIVLTRVGITGDQAYGGVRVTQKQPKSPISGSHLVRCDNVNFPSTATPLSLGDRCGSDPLTTGSADLGAAGTLTVSVTGAALGATYEVWFRPIDTNGSADVDTGISLTTNSTKGNGKASGSAETSGDIGSGSFVVKGTGTNAGLDEFLPGFEIK